MDSEAAAICAATRIPFVYKTWPAAMAGEVPYPHLRYWRESSRRIAADNATYLMVDEYELMLVTESKDEASEGAVESAFDDAGVVPSDPMEVWVPDERLFQVSWNFQLIRKNAPETGEAGETGVAGA